MNEHSEKALLKALRGEEQREIDKALAELYLQYYPLIKRLIKQNSGTEEEADEVFQDVVYTFYTKLRQEGLELYSTIQTYLYSIARNMWLNELRRRSSAPRLVETNDYLDLSSDQLSAMILTEQNKEMAKLIQGLGEQCQQILNYYYFERFKMKKVAELMGFTNEQVAKNKKSKCLKKLKTLVQDKQEWRQWFQS